jgi:hypothetical protein
MDWDKYAENFKKKGRWAKWKEWNQLSPDEREYLKSMYALTPPPPPKGPLTRIGSWPTSNIIGLWLAVGVAFLLSLVLTAQYSEGGGSHFDLPVALRWWLFPLVPGLALTWVWLKAQEAKK